jgi:hypothetical protein
VLVVHAATEDATTQVQRIVGQSMAGAASPVTEAHSVG